MPLMIHKSTSISKIRRESSSCLQIWESTSLSKQFQKSIEKKPLLFGQKHGYVSYQKMLLDKNLLICLVAFYFLLDTKNSFFYHPSWVVRLSAMNLAIAASARFFMASRSIPGCATLLVACGGGRGGSRRGHDGPSLDWLLLLHGCCCCSTFHLGFWSALNFYSALYVN